MIQYDVIIRDRKTGEERILPEPVYDANIDDLNQQYDYVGRQEITTDGSTPVRPEPAPTAHQVVANQTQTILEELLKLREENRALKQLQEEGTKKTKKAA